MLPLKAPHRVIAKVCCDTLQLQTEQKFNLFKTHTFSKII